MVDEKKPSGSRAQAEVCIFGEDEMVLMGRADSVRHGGSGSVDLSQARGPKDGADKVRLDVYKLVTARIIERLEQGTVPWQSPSIARVGFPRNFATGKYYQGINVFLLASAEYESPFFLTFIQAKELGGNVKKGEKGLPVVKVGTYIKAEDGTKTPRLEDADEADKRLYLKHYTVFNASQIEGIEFPPLPKCETYTESEQAESARLIVEGMPNRPVINEGRKAKPCYIPSTDEVEMPGRATFRAEWRFFKTLFHELAHSTGHQSRLARKTLLENKGMASFGTEAKTYCQEELVAEMTAAFLGAHAGIIEDDFENSAAYLKSWLDVLKVSNHKKWLVQAASEAQKAANYILNAGQGTGAAEAAQDARGDAAMSGGH